MAPWIFIVVNEHPLESASLAMGVRLHKKLREVGVDIGEKPVKIRQDVAVKGFWKSRNKFRELARTAEVVKLAEANPMSIVISFHNYGIDKYGSFGGARGALSSFLRETEIPEKTMKDVSGIEARNNLFELISTRGLPGYKGNLYFVEMACPARQWKDRKTRKTHTQFAFKDAKEAGFLKPEVVDALATKMCRFFKKKLGYVPLKRPPVRKRRPSIKKPERKKRLGRK